MQRGISVQRNHVELLHELGKFVVLGRATDHFSLNILLQEFYFPPCIVPFAQKCWFLWTPKLQKVYRSSWDSRTWFFFFLFNLNKVRAGLVASLLPASGLKLPIWFVLLAIIMAPWPVITCHGNPVCFSAGFPRTSGTRWPRVIPQCESVY